MGGTSGNTLQVCTTAFTEDHWYSQGAERYPEKAGAARVTRCDIINYREDSCLFLE